MKQYPALALLCFGLAMMLPACGKSEPKPVAIDTLIKQPTLNLEEQKRVAQALFKRLQSTDSSQLDVFETNYKIVINKCPDTQQAHRAVHRLTKLYTLAYEEPRYEDIITVLEPFLERTKTSTYLAMEKYPEEQLAFSPVAALHRAYTELKRYDKIAAYYDNHIKTHPELGAYDCFDYAEALDHCNRPEDAKHWYRKFLEVSQGSADMEFTRQIARDRVEELNK